MVVSFVDDRISSITVAELVVACDAGPGDSRGTSVAELIVMCLEGYEPGARPMSLTTCSGVWKWGCVSWRWSGAAVVIWC